MQRLFSLLLLVSLAAVPVCGQRRGRGFGTQEAAPLRANSPFEKKVIETMETMVRNGDLYANVPAADGRLMRILAETANAQHVVEIGTSTGLSGLWFSLALEKTGGRLTTFELDKTRAALARKHFQMAGVERRITIVEGDAHENIRALKGPIDVVFLDAEKEGYVDYLNKLLPLVRPGGLILAHNVDMVPDYMRAVSANAALDTVVYSSGGGLAVTIRKR
ncbi:MAG: class I SAM-dependent methyltransferase [Acidobacteria bacterium]|nr:class I SAM-dependent methyltransferase [Acidobacteriota bacterium]